MIVICDECGKKYRIDPSKIKGTEARFKCKSCNHIITVTKPEGREPTPQPPAPPPLREAARPAEAKTPPPQPKPRKKVDETTVVPVHRPKKRRVGLRQKMFVLFVFVPIVLMAAASLFYLQRLDSLSSLITNESTAVASQLAEAAIQEKARSTARQVSLYVSTHPNLRKENYNTTGDFTSVAVQKVGETGYTALYELPGYDGVWRTWAHVNPKIVSIDMASLKKPLGKSFPGFWKVYSGVEGGKESQGYYTWQDKDGKFRDKFMVCTPVEGTRFIIAATTYLDEFTRPVKKIEGRAEEIKTRTRNISAAILLGTLVLVGLIVAVYGNALVNKIKYLTDVAERISVGELDAEIELRSEDEIGDLGDAISRMQDSIRLSIERLRRRR